MKPVGLFRRLFAATVLSVALARTGASQTQITLEQANSRVKPDFMPAYVGDEVVVSGQIASRPIWITDSYYLGIQDAAFYGLLLQDTGKQFEALEPGDWIEARGLLTVRGGRPIVLPRDVRRIGHGMPPAPKLLKPSEVASFRYLGVLVTTDGVVADKDENAGGDLLLIDQHERDLSVFFPRKRRDSGPQLGEYHRGDHIRITGIASQYCTLPPFDRYFQILIPAPNAVLLLERSWAIQPPVLLGALILAGALAAIWWFRERHMAMLRKQMRLLNALGEQVVGASSPAEILRRLTSMLPALSGASGVGVYVNNRRTKMLDGIHSASAAESTVNPEDPRGGLETAVIACFRNRALIAIPDTRRSPYFPKDAGSSTPRSVLLVPMLAQSELMGVLEVQHTARFHYFSPNEQAAIQHLANQIATALKLQEQQSIREQLFRSEKLAAAGQLISDVANELQSPLQSIAVLASDLQASKSEDDLSEEELERIIDEARRASDIVARLVSFAHGEQAQAEPVDVNALLSSLLKFRAPEWKVKGVEIRSQLGNKRAMVMAAPGQLEQVLLNLLVDAEKSAADARDKTITVASSMLANRVLVEMTYPTRGSELPRTDSVETDPAGSQALGLGVCRGIIQSYGGEFRVVHVSPSQIRFDVELPMIDSRGEGVGGLSGLGEAGRQLTVLVVEPDTKVQRQLVQLLGERGDRVIPVSSADEGGDIAQRLRFDMIICSVRLPGLNWVEFYERVRRRVGGFVLMTDAFDNTVARAFKSSDGFVLNKPIDETELLRICRTIEERVAVS